MRESATRGSKRCDGEYGADRFMAHFPEPMGGVDSITSVATEAC